MRKGLAVAELEAAAAAAATAILEVAAAAMTTTAIVAGGAAAAPAAVRAIAVAAAHETALHFLQALGAAARDAASAAADAPLVRKGLAVAEREAAAAGLLMNKLPLKISLPHASPSAEFASTFSLQYNTPHPFVVAIELQQKEKEVSDQPLLPAL